MEKVEYKVIDRIYASDLKNLEHELNKFGQEGYVLINKIKIEYTSIFAHDVFVSNLIFMKRISK